MFRQLFDFFIFTSLFIACCAVLMVHQASLLFDTSFSVSYYLFVFSGSVCSYNFHWYLTPPGVPAWSKKLRWNLSNKKQHGVLALTGLAGAAVASFFLLDYWAWLALTALLTFLYSAPKIDHPLARRLRSIAVGKTIYLALAWTHVTALLPLLLEKDGLTSPEVWYVVNRFFFIYTICIVFDRRDRDSDRKSGIKSLVTWLDEKGVDLLFWLSQVAVAATLAVLAQWLAPAELLVLLLPALILGLLYQKAKKSRSDYLYYFLLDGLMAASAPILILLSFARQFF